MSLDSFPTKEQHLQAPFLGSKETEFPANEKSKMPFTSWCSIQIKLRCSKERTETTLAFSKLYGQTILTC